MREWNVHVLPGHAEASQGNHNATAKSFSIKRSDRPALEGQEAFNWYQARRRNRIKQVARNAFSVVEKSANLHEAVRNPKGGRDYLVVILEAVLRKIEAGDTSPV